MKLFFWVLISFFFSTFSFSCTDFKVTAEDGTVVIIRSLEFAEDTQSHLRSSKQGRAYNTTAPDGSPALNWNAKYGYLYLDAYNENIAIEGMNEMGLSFEALYLPGIAEYQTVPEGHNRQALPYTELGDWVLSNFKNVDEVKDALTQVYVFKQTLPSTGDTIFPLHFSIFEASGKGIVVEYIKGQLRIHDHLGVMTNSPAYGWHRTNLNNYLNLNPYNPAPVKAGNYTFSATGQGAGMLGLPGDISPPSRFVKTAFMLKNAYSSKNADEAINLGEHIINNVDIPEGISRAVENGKETTEKTQWVVFKDLTHKIFYFRTYHDLSLRFVNLKKLDFSKNAPTFKMQLEDVPKKTDLTKTFLSH